MIESKHETSKKSKVKTHFRTRAALLMLQILLPFGLYFALEWDNFVSAGVIAILFVFSMFVLVWLG